MTTTNEQWLPLGVDGDEAVDFTALREDVPDWLYRSLWTWIWDQFTARNSGSGRIFSIDVARECERVLKITIPDAGKYDGKSFQAIQQSVKGPPLLTWRLVDYLVSRLWHGSDVKKSLEKMLLESGSAWEIGERAGKIALVRRLPEGVQAAAVAAFQAPNAGKRLAQAWETAYGVNPDPTKAYSLAVKAVEDAAIPVVCPSDRSATLGKVIGQVNAGTWKLPHLREDAKSPTHELLVGMLRTLWTGQHDRHGGPSSVGVPAVTQAEAESAVLLAVTLVGWFEGGKVQL